MAALTTYLLFEMMEAKSIRESQCNIQVLSWSLEKPSHRPRSIHFENFHSFKVIKHLVCCCLNMKYLQGTEKYRQHY